MRTVVAAGLVASVLLAFNAPVVRTAPACGACMVSRYWSIDPNEWADTRVRSTFPETKELAAMRPEDLGIAFSGGGTRSAAATVGQLRGLRDSGWLDKVRYISAVSGGSWASVPYVYSPLSLDALLGAAEQPADLTLAALDGKTAARGALAAAVAKSSLLPGATLEIGDRLAQHYLQDQYRRIASALFQRLNGPDAGRADKMYARLLDRIFIAPLVTKPLSQGGDAPRLFSWTDASVADIATVNRELRGVARINPTEFAVAARNRPFLIASGTIVVRPDDHAEFPQLVPVEYTPLYVGARQQHGAAIGGTYVSPFAYDAEQAIFERADAATGGRTGVVAIGPAGASGRFSLADVIASSGAAPQLHLLVDAADPKLDPALRRMAGFFPNYRNIAVRVDAGGATGLAGATGSMPHGDGGFVDNLGLLPLLARHVTNVIVFVNGMVGHRREGQLSAYFWPTGSPDGNGTRRLDAVFDPAHWQELMSGLDKAYDAGGPVVYCGKNWTVQGNEHYNVQPYDGLNICWVYNSDNPDTSQWRAALRPDVRAWMFPDKAKQQRGPYEKEFARFPWFRTFGEDAPHVIQLKPRQVNVLANFTSWAVTHSATQKAFRETLTVTPPR